ncbi:PH domain-containing protein [Stygiolobus caldivivus]|uniref:YdbS-like PH domain-containing protein n=1 Tax=Stygiolobus caldivivus TaxID=2824673 RepID=A0A8D5ZIZ0_9CREN|nr:PH domain-containing protein [Stygiolobus caldivivus]BCU71024.1 hypothetical protein KN1_23210 [Stygiolobus caldivivus]
MLVVRPKISKTITKGSILIFLFSIFLNISRIEDFVIFIGISFLLLSIYSVIKYMSYYEISEDYIIIHNLISTKKIRYTEIEDGFLSQGWLARRFNCGSIYIFLKGGRRIEILRDIPDPLKIEDEIKKKIDYS